MSNNILVVDDNAMNRDMLGRRLSRHGYNILYAEDGFKALDIIKNQEIDIVLLDVMMPEIDGFEVLQRLRKIYTPILLPIIMVTAVGQSSEIARAFELGANDYITKPIDFTIALARLKTQLAYKHSGDLLRKYNSVTGLPNHILFKDRLEQRFQLEKSSHSSEFAVLHCEINGLKDINNSFGYCAGDQLLKEVSNRIASIFKKNKYQVYPDGSTIISHFGGCEYPILLPDIKHPSVAIMISSQIQDVLKEPFELNNEKTFISSNIGIALYNNNYNSSEDLLRDASIARTRACEQSKNCYHLFDSMMQPEIKKRLILESELRQAIECEQFEVFYQPILNLKTHDYKGVEAVIRWNHPEKGILLPADFLTVLEEIELLEVLDRWVLKRACQQVHFWQNNYNVDKDFSVSVNVSGTEILNDDFVRFTASALDQSQLSADKLFIEITEGVLINHPKKAIENIQQLRDLNVQISLDDFGTGYSSLSYLQQFPANILKIDRSFVNDMEKLNGKEIVNTIILLAHHLGMKVVAEGIETEKQLDALIKRGCEYGQGFYFAKPLSAEDFESLLQERKVA